MKKLSKAEEDQLTQLFESFWMILPKGSGAKVGKGGARDAWFKKFKKVKRENWLELFNVIKEAFLKQEAYRKKMLDAYPDERSRKAAGVFIPSRPHCSTWINQERWHDEVQKIKDPAEVVVGKTCLECQEPGTQYVEDGNMLCSWHWTRRFDRKHLRLLADTLESIGLARQEKESMDDWSNRCREHLRKTNMGRMLGA